MHFILSAHADGSYHLMGCMLSAASCNKWWSEEILGTKDYSAEQAPIKELGENHVYFLPYLMGERSPHNNPDARGVFFGMTMDTTRADMTQAVLEGVAFGLRDSLEVARSLGIQIERTKICGGGAKSPLWKKMIANIMNLKVDVLEVEEGPIIGRRHACSSWLRRLPGCGNHWKEAYKDCGYCGTGTGSCGKV